MSREKAIAYLEDGYVVMISGGTGNPYFTTDTASALRAVEIKADAILKGTRVDGVYTADPEKDKKAKKYETLSFDEAYKKNLEKEIQKLRAGKANPQMLEGVKIDYYGVMTPIDQTANISSPDARQIIVQPWDKSVLGLIEKAILAANLGFNPKNEGEILRIQVPPLTEERRRDLVKKAKAEAENAKISIRNIRRNANETAKKLKKDGVPEDEVDKAETDIQKVTDEYIEKVDKIFEIKEKDIMTV